MTLRPEEYVTHIRQALSIAGNPGYAQAQMEYMRNKFDFYGLKAPQWMALTKAHHAQYGLPDPDDLKTVSRLCFDDEHREMHYFALETIQKQLKKQPADFIWFLEELIQTQSWWDSVDWINKLVGLHFKQYPHLILPVTQKWMASNHIWLQRVCLIFQLPYREKTDAGLMFTYIRQLAHSKEFFIQKAAGWALRQYTRTNPEAVETFVTTTPLAPLTKREALRLIKRD